MSPSNSSPTTTDKSDECGMPPRGAPLGSDRSCLLGRGQISG